MSIVKYNGKVVKYGSKWVNGGLPPVGEDWHKYLATGNKENQT